MSDCRLETGFELGQFLLGAGQADFKAFNFAEPASCCASVIRSIRLSSVGIGA